MPYWTPADNDVLTAAVLQTNVGDQVVSQVDSGSHPSGVEGQVIYEDDNDAFLAFDGTDFREIMRLAAWHSFTPTIDGATSDPARVNGTWTGQYFLLGSLGVFLWSFVFGSSDTFGSGEWRLVLPHSLTADNSVAWRFGAFQTHDSGTTSNNQVMMPYINTGDATLIRLNQVSNAAANLSPTIPFTWATNDQLIGFAVVPLTF